MTRLMLAGFAVLSFGCAAQAGAGAQVGTAYSAPYITPATQQRSLTRPGFSVAQSAQIEAFEARERRISMNSVDPYKAQQKAIAAHNDRVLADEREHHLHMAELANDPQYAVTAMSAAICQMKGDIKDLEASLARENRVAKTGGAVDLRHQHDAAERIEDTRDNIRDWTKRLREKFGVAPTACTAMPALLACHDDHETCDQVSAEQDDLLRNGTDELQR